MAKRSDGRRPPDNGGETRGGGSPSAERGFLWDAGARYWTASVLPVLVGTTLPFWLRPPGFSFKALGALEVLVAALLLHAGFSLLGTRFADEPEAHGRNALSMGLVFIAAASALGLHLNTMVPGNAFLVLGVCALFVGALYVVPPLSFRKRAFGEVVLSVGLGLLPVLAAYLVQAGDLTRRVYLASVPIVFATALWVWTAEMVERVADEKAGRQTLVTLLGSSASGRLMVPILAVFVYASMFGAVFTASMIPLALVAILSFGLARTVVAVSWNDYAMPSRMIEARTNAFKLHLVIGIIVAASALAALHA